MAWLAGIARVVGMGAARGAAAEGAVAAEGAAAGAAGAGAAEASTGSKLASMGRNAAFTQGQGDNNNKHQPVSQTSMPNIMDYR